MTPAIARCVATRALPLLPVASAVAGAGSDQIADAAIEEARASHGIPAEQPGSER